MKKIIILSLFIFLPFWGFGQFLNNFYGSLESVGQYYVDDNKIANLGDIDFRSNNYLNFRYIHKNLSVQIQLESYIEERILGYSPVFDKKIGLAALSLSYNFKKIEAIVGSFHDQFGSGLLFRSWEDRALGLNNSLFGAQIKYYPQDKIEITAMAGKQRNGFELSEGSIFGLDFKVDVTNKFNFSLGYLNRYQKLENNPNNIPDHTNLYSARVNYFGNSFYGNLEYVYKGKDALVEFGNVIESRMFTGNALLFNLGYFHKGFGIDATFRRLENMAMYTDREAYGNIYNELVVNYLPALTKQHNLILSSIYVYQSQPQLNFIPPGKAGEIGQQIDMFYKFTNNNSLAGKFKTELALNYSSWYGLDAIFDFENLEYSAEYFSYGTKYYSDLNFELRNEWSNNWSTTLTLIHQFYNKQFLESATGSASSDIIGLDLFYNWKGTKKFHLQLEHLWNDDDKKNWAAALVEYHFYKNFSVYVSDLYNYGNEHPVERIHYYNFGGSFRKNKTRFSINYGRQRGGLLCVGGVCRFVPNANGLSFILNVFI